MFIFCLHNKLKKKRISLFLLQSYLLISQVGKIEAVDMKVLKLWLSIYKTHSILLLEKFVSPPQFRASQWVFILGQQWQYRRREKSNVHG